MPDNPEDREQREKLDGMKPKTREYLGSFKHAMQHKMQREYAKASFVEGSTEKQGLDYRAIVGQKIDAAGSFSKFIESLDKRDLEAIVFMRNTEPEAMEKMSAALLSKFSKIDASFENMLHEYYKNEKSYQDAVKSFNNRFIAHSNNETVTKESNRILEERTAKVQERESALDSSFNKLAIAFDLITAKDLKKIKPPHVGYDQSSPLSFYRDRILGPSKNQPSTPKFRS